MPAPEDFYAYLPQHKYIYIPTRELWTSASINSTLGRIDGVSGRADFEFHQQHGGYPRFFCSPSRCRVNQETSSFRLLTASRN